MENHYSHSTGYGKTFPAIPFSCAMATVATERNYGNSAMERHSGKTERRNSNGRLETRRYSDTLLSVTQT